METSLEPLSLVAEEDEGNQVPSSPGYIQSQYDFCLFYNDDDLESVMTGLPWHFSRHLLLWHKLQGHEDPLLVPLLKTKFWVQIHDLSAGFMMESIATMLGNFIGELVEYDMRPLPVALWKFMRILVRLDITKQLQWRTKLITPSGEAIFVLFRYEKLFVFIRKLGHMDNYCELRLHRHKEDLQL
ncbi:uncharacterized protein LOC105641367 [Jatropha curcas]|uniref:uncharacterized protein LOC105641367 n=1 Tax=Jatropha curcas TaxID=180498 RepID=UPI0005FBE646|nr:uncharacterized protein LOC105641367 [Jatropha curcas]